MPPASGGIDREEQPAGHAEVHEHHQKDEDMNLECLFKAFTIRGEGGFRNNQSAKISHGRAEAGTDQVNTAK